MKIRIHCFDDEELVDFLDDFKPDLLSFRWEKMFIKNEKKNK